MQYIETAKPKPYKIVPTYTPNQYEYLDNGDIKVTEINKNEVYLTKEEAFKVLKSINDKIKFKEHEISSQHINSIKEEIEKLKIIRDDWDKALNWGEDNNGKQ